MVQKFNRGDKVVVSNVKDASSVGYLGSLRKVLLIAWSPRHNEYNYFTESVLGTGGAWFFESELTATGK